jgi:hypothetical protein
MTGTLASNLPVMTLSLVLRPIGKKAVGFVSVRTVKAKYVLIKVISVCGCELQMKPQLSPENL